MPMPCSITGDMSMGHTGFTPSPITPTTTKVLVTNVPPHVTGDAIAIHILGNSAHVGTIGPGSSSVLAQNKVLSLDGDMDWLSLPDLGSMNNAIETLRRKLGFYRGK